MRTLLLALTLAACGVETGPTDAPVDLQATAAAMPSWDCQVSITCAGAPELDLELLGRGWTETEAESSIADAVESEPCDGALAVHVYCTAPR